MEFKFEKLTVAKAALWIGEAWGQDIKPRDVRLRGRWIFIRNDYDVDCVPMPYFSLPTTHDIYGEPWTAIRHKESPFVEKDKEKIAALIDRLDDEYGFTDKPQFDICLFATEGDCAAGAMSGQPDFIPIHNEDFPLIADYLRNQNECTILSVEDCLKNSGTGKWKFSRKYQNAMSKSHDLGNALIENGIFHHKWHKRTTWEIRDMENNYPVNIEPGANACFKREGEE